MILKPGIVETASVGTCRGLPHLSWGCIFISSPADGIFLTGYIYDPRSRLADELEFHCGGVLANVLLWLQQKFPTAAFTKKWRRVVPLQVLRVHGPAECAP